MFIDFVKQRAYEINPNLTVKNNFTIENLAKQLNVNPLYLTNSKMFCVKCGITYKYNENMICNECGNVVSR